MLHHVQELKNRQPIQASGDCNQYKCIKLRMLHLQ